MFLISGESQTAQLVKYVVSGSIAASVHLGVLVALIELARLDATLSSAIGFLAALLVNYSLQYKWVFSSGGSHLVRGLRYIFVTALTLLVNVLLFWILHEKLAIWYPGAQIIAIGVVFLVNFYLNRRFTFRDLT